MLKLIKFRAVQRWTAPSAALFKSVGSLRFAFAASVSQLMGSEGQSHAQGQKDGITVQTLWPKLAQLSSKEWQEWEQTIT